MSQFAFAAVNFWYRVRWHLGRKGLHKLTLELERNAILPLGDPRGLRIGCLDGVLWITQDEDPGDVVLEAGQAHVLQGKRKAVLLALEPARFSIELQR